MTPHSPRARITFLLTGLLGLALPAAAQDRWFANQQFSASLGGIDLAVGDFDSDGNADIVTSGGQLLHGDGNGRFGVAQDFVAGAMGPSSNCYPTTPIVVGDVNADGRDDVVLFGGCFAPPQPVVCRLGNGPAPFLTTPTFYVPQRPVCARLADMDEDGFPDLVTSTSASAAKVSILRGNGDGTFQAGVDTPVAWPREFVVVDVNADGHLDVVTTSGNQVSVLLGDGAGGLALFANYSLPSGTQASGLAAGDIDGDGDLDLVTANEPSSNASVLRGDATGAFAFFYSFPIGAPCIQVDLLDMNADGRLDVVTTNEASQSVAVALGTGAGLFSTARKYATGRSAFRVELRDFDGDGDIDLATLSSFARAVMILDGDGLGGFLGTQEYHGLVNQPRSMAAGDLDADGHVDLVTGNDNAGSISVLLGTGTGSMSPATTFLGGTSPRLVAVGDFDGDARRDVVVANVNVWAVTVYLGNGQGGFASVLSYGLGILSEPNSIATGDFDGDGRSDLVTRNSFLSGTTYTTTLSILLADASGALGAPTSYTIGNGNSYPGLAVGDVDGDGDLDIVSMGGFGTQVTTLLGDGAGGFTILTSPSLGDYLHTLALGDVDGDGDLDLVGARPHVSGAYPDGIEVRLGDGSGGFGPVTFIVLDSVAGTLVVRDMNADGATDIVAAHGEIDSLSVLAGDGNGGFLAAQRFSAPWNPRAIAVEDFDEDGLPDVAIVSGTSTFPSWRLSILRNQSRMSPAGTPYCFGDGTGTPCPCGNAGASGHGCASSTDSAGALLVAQGQPSLGNDTLVLAGLHMPHTTTALFIQGTSRTLGGAGTVFGDGLRCASGAVVRLKSVSTTSGSMQYPNSGDLPIALRGNVTSPGIRTYQAWYRNAAAFCTSSTFNLTNGVEVSWQM